MEGTPRRSGGSQPADPQSSILCSFAMFLTSIDTRPGQGDDRWTYIGDPDWRADDDGVLYPPVFANPRFDRGDDQVPDLYAHPLAREDYAILADTPLEDTDIAFDYTCPYGAVLHGGAIVRATGGMCGYILDFLEMGRKAQAYEVILWLQDESGYRRQLARAQVPHSIIPERINQKGTPTRFLWDHSAPEWMRFRLQASSSVLRVSADGRILFELRDETFSAGCVGLVARGSVYFRNVEIHGFPAEDASPWTPPESDEIPAFFLPGDPQPEGFNAYPVVCRAPDGDVLVAWAHDPNPSRHGKGDGTPGAVLTRSSDDGATWTSPAPVWQGSCYNFVPSSLFAHQDGSLSLLAITAPDPNTPARCKRLRSTDGGKTWSIPEDLTVAGRSLNDRPFINPYSPMQRLSNGIVVMTLYEADDSQGHENDVRRDRALLLRSEDDGHTWTEEPVYLDPDNFDHNECMVAEIAPGRLIAFMRTLRAPFMWTSHSEDGGSNWTQLMQTDISAECPCLLAHSSGALVLGSRGLGLFLRVSRDGGWSWGETWRVSPMSAMMGMMELDDGRILLIGHEGYRIPGNIRGQYIELTPERPRAGHGVAT